MIAIGGAIGTGLFLGAGGRLAAAGPALVFIYAVCGFFAFLVLRALGELVMHRPSSGSFVSYAREFFGEKAAFTAGWLYWLNWAMTAIVDVTAVALYMNFFKKYWAPIAAVPQWVWALAALVLVLGLNLVSVKVFGEMEFWFALIKVVALVAFLLVGTYFVIFGTPVDGQRGRLQPDRRQRRLAAQRAAAGHRRHPGRRVRLRRSIELIGTDRRRDREPGRRSCPRPSTPSIVRIAVFYVGSVLLLVLLLPYTAYKAGESARS